MTAAKKKQPVPPLGAVVQGYVEPREGARLGTRYLARARWTHPATHKRESASVTFGSQDEADAWIDAQKVIARTGLKRSRFGGGRADFSRGFLEMRGITRWVRHVGRSRTSTRRPR